MGVRDYDIVLLGATGFTGGLAAAYLAANGGPNLRWAIAGRNRDKLLQVQQALGTARPVPVLVADTSDDASLQRLAASTRVLMTTVGPYARYGEPVVAACVDAATHYVDITGEPAFVDKMWAVHDAAARARGVRIVNCCGFDSVPHDLGALFAVKQLPPDQSIRLRGFVSSRGTFSGGTLHSAIHAMGDALGHAKWRRNNPTPASNDGRNIRLEKPRVYYENVLESWAAPLPTIDPDIVRRTALLRREFGSDFRYGHYARIRKASTLVAGGAGVALLGGLAQFGPTRRTLLKLRAPGEGPSERQRKRAWFEVRFIGQSGDGQSIHTKVTGGDPGYTETAKMLCESALCLAFDQGSVPKAAGVLTPGAAMGEPLIDRLQRAGIGFEVVSPTRRASARPGHRPAQPRPLF